jgi:CDP-diacylglycerol pyrophosphatase
LLNKPLAGHRYRTMRVAESTLKAHNPFKLLARGVPGASADMGRRTLVVVGMRLDGARPGFAILADRAAPARGDFAGGEELQDHSCALGRR